MFMAWPGDFYEQISVPCFNISIHSKGVCRARSLNEIWKIFLDIATNNIYHNLCIKWNQCSLIARTLWNITSHHLFENSVTPLSHLPFPTPPLVLFYIFFLHNYHLFSPRQKNFRCYPNSSSNWTLANAPSCRALPRLPSILGWSFEPKTIPHIPDIIVAGSLVLVLSFKTLGIILANQSANTQHLYPQISCIIFALPLPL